MLYNKAKIHSHYDASILFASARKPELGKPVNSWCRLFADGEKIILRNSHYNRDFAVIHPNNTLEWVADRKTMRMLSATLTGAIHKLLPIALRRVGTGRYLAHSTYKLDDKPPYYDHGETIRTNGVKLFEGLKYDLGDNTFINPEPSSNFGIDEHKRLVWLRSLRAFKKGIKVRAKMGVFEPLCAQVHQERQQTKNWRAPDWYSDQWTDLLYTSIRDQDFSTELLKGFTQSAHVAYWRNEPPKPSRVLDAVDTVCNDMSYELRTRFGVFKESCDETDIHY